MVDLKLEEHHKIVLNYKLHYNSIPNFVSIPMINCT